MKNAKLVELNANDQDALIARILIANLPDSDKEILTGLIEFNNWLQFNVQEKSISISRLQNIFDNSIEKSNRKKKNSKPGSKDKDKSKDEEKVAPDESCNTQLSEIDTIKNSSKGKKFWQVKPFCLYQR